MREIEVSKRTYNYMVKLYENEGTAFSAFKYWLEEDVTDTDVAAAFREMSHKTGNVPSVFLHQFLTGEFELTKEEETYVFWKSVNGVKRYYTNYTNYGITEDFIAAEEFYEEEDAQEIEALEILGWVKEKIN